MSFLWLDVRGYLSNQSIVSINVQLLRWIINYSKGGMIHTVGTIYISFTIVVGNKCQKKKKWSKEDSIFSAIST